MATDFFSFQATPGGNLLDLHLPESLDAIEFDHFNSALQKLMENRSGQKWIVDLTDVAYLGSAMLGMLVNMRQQVKSHSGKLILCGMSPRLMEIFRTCCMERLFTIVKDKAAASSAR